MLNRLSLAALATVVLAAPAMAQNVPTRTLSKPDAEFEEPFTGLIGVRELKDGRVIVADPRDKIVAAVDFKSGSQAKLGREGSGPGEYGLPTRMLPMGNDTTGIVDILNNRILLINPNATVGGFVDLNAPTPTASAGRGGGGMMMVGNSMPQMADNKGRMYIPGSPFQMVNGQPQPADSTALMRWERKSGKRDTVAWLHVPKGNAQISGGRGNMSIRIGGSAPFQGADQMAVAPDGRIAIAHFNPYRIEYVSETGQHTMGPEIRYDRVKVSEGHKQEWRDSRKNAMGMMMTNDNGRRSASMVPMRDVQDPEDWGDEYMPPFLSSQNPLQFSNDGFLWVRRTGPAGMAPTYDVFDRGGNLVQKVVLPQRTRLIGFGNGTVYTIRLDEDDLQYLQRHRFSMPERP